ncbi:TorF family putative porin [Novosphingobium album (ex Liu et al. 2023)]|uniref:TorF family putative porin n=1 Tax=Novosphingobium album (ex Liu et al. 2023) TaxID=3031130 RepID=A0ABT5WSU3_9SPHN|nr:TorF family putative porin [Novosphingobium album (ex Liu et al. 2023)]MDE8653107.1 TorF family putative porin [Novosphingobium album (ex Liu et al. 2023)]
MRTLLIAGLLGLAVSTPALAQEEESGPISVSGSVALVSDYRFRGVSQSDKELAVQGGVTVSHESGLYVGTWASNLSGWGTFGGSNTELDIFGGYAMDIGGATLDVGLTWYMYPGGADTTDFAEGYAKLSSTLGPVNVLAGVAYAPKQDALGNYSNTPSSRGQKQDNLYLWGDVNMGIPETPLTVKAHFGYSNGNPGLGPNGTSVAPTGEYLDWLLGADYALGPVTLGVAYVDTNITKSEAAYLQPNFSSTKNGSSIAGSTVVFSLTAAF